MGANREVSSKMEFTAENEGTYKNWTKLAQNLSL
jgi:hypothetical protein